MMGASGESSREWFMRICIDEGGTFQVVIGRKYLYSVVVALVIPSCRENDLFYGFLRLRNGWNNPAIEVKGSQLDEHRIAQVIALLASYDVVLEFCAIDMAWHSDTGVTAFKLDQARKLLASLTPAHHATLVAELTELSKLLEALPNQLFVQMFVTIELILETIQAVTLYYCQRIPAELGRFDWLIDRKDEHLTSMEKLWSTLIAPIASNRGLEEPFITLKEGDYSHFERFRVKRDAVEMHEYVKWLDENIRVERGAGERRIFNVALLLKESLNFAESKDELGLQLADIVASACRRAFNGNLQQIGWEGLGQLLIKKNEKPPIIGLRTPGKTDYNFRLHEEAAEVWLTLDGSAKSMWN
jgi:hypothetical protein